ncbi:hypothetical protein HRG_001865 [Hirsutella rhossiliensis]|uniref:VTC domain-containing protein n=1 Tax=Hirsutella rhossiliensis TaxID=111463 RepID=A0A9P8SMT0_9HYPO|nr:VTC domain-containing protein [Hirsutella rhossiliensis]KAH0966456.1 VTC domain-containing protein [Hirsutella rhossiliensis]
MQEKEGKKKKSGGFLGGLLRNRSLAIRRGSRATVDDEDTSRDGADSSKGTRSRNGDDDDATAPRRSPHGPALKDRPRSRRRARHPDHPEPGPGPGLASGPSSGSPAHKTGRKSSGKGKGKAVEESDNGDAGGSASALTRKGNEWPPRGMPSDGHLSRQRARELICRGAPTHRGRRQAVAHAPDHCHALYATTSCAGGGTDAAGLHDSMTQLMTLRLAGRGPAEHPWETLEQPSYGFHFGERPGTVTLNHWASMASVLPPALTLRDPGVEPRTMDLARILGRLQELEAGLEDDDEDLLYRILYRRILRDPDRYVSPHRTLDRQMTDLILVLSRPGWIDFTDPENQVPTRFLLADHEGTYRRFLHQLLLSLELELRINAPQHGDYAKEKLLRQIPPTIQWGLALARRWREHVRVEAYGTTPKQTRLRYKLKRRQVKMLRRFAQMIKWPNLGATLGRLAQVDEEGRLDSLGADAFAFFSGLVLPGPTFPFLIMNTLIDMDPDRATNDLARLSATTASTSSQHCGFQYRSSHTYWSAGCIVGKVLAPTCRGVAGWVGPGRPTADLGRTQTVRIRSRRPRDRGKGMAAADVESMEERSDPLGPEAEAYPVGDYELAEPQTESGFVVDAVRMELLGFKPVMATGTTSTTTMDTTATASSAVAAYDATIQFAIDGLSWPLRLMYDVDFVAAWPCSHGPHPLFFDYVFRTVRVDEVVRVRDWGRGGGRGPWTNGNARAADDEDVDDEEVLVVEAFGVRDNEALARAWCSHWGLSAVVADVDRTCLACAIREAYSATLTVVILVDDRLRDVEDG